jgi:hypothetical protein
MLKGLKRNKQMTTNNLNLTYGNSNKKKYSSSSAYPILFPCINSLSKNYSIAGSTTIITIFGNNFRDFSLIRFSENTFPCIFINSTQICFYIPTNYTHGIYTIQIFNGNNASNIVNFTIDDNGSYWALNTNNNSISNLNNGAVNMNCSVFAEFFNSYSYPGAYLYTSTGTNYPIYCSVISYRNFYENNFASSDNSFKTIGLCYISNTNFIKHISVDNDDHYLVSPGYQLIVKNGENITLKISNLSNKPVLGCPISIPNDSCLLYYWTNSGWNILQSKSNNNIV